MFKNYFTTAIRNIWRNKTYSALNIFGLAVGIACAGLIFLWAENEWSWDNFHAKKDRLFQLKVNMTFGGNNFTMGSTPRPMAKALLNEIPGIANTARVSDEGQRLLFKAGNRVFYATGLYADAALCTMFSFDFIEGHAKNAFPQLHSLIITQSTARKFFGGTKNIVGKTIRIDNKQDYVVSGVVKDLPQNSTLQFEWLASYEIKIVENKVRAIKDKITLTDDMDWSGYGPFTYVELDKTANLTTINNQLKDFIPQRAPDQTSQTFLYPMAQWHLFNEFTNGKPTGGGAITQVRLLAVIAWIILFIACINFMNLATANSHKRAREIGVRKVLGAEKTRLVFQFLTEALFLSAIAAVFAVIIISIALPTFNALMQKQLSLHLESPFHITGLLVIVLICGLVAGSYPAWYLSSFHPVLVLKGLKMKNGSAAFIRKGLVVFQFAASVVFIISTVIVYLQIQHVKNRNLGFHKNNLIEINPERAISKVFPLIKNDLLSTGVIQNVALADHSILQGGNTDNRFRWQGKPDGQEVSIANRSVSPEFIAASGLEIIDGRDFRNNTSAEKSKVIINKAMADLMGQESAVGKIIQSPRGNADNVFTNMTVIGVVNDYVYGNIYGKAQPLIIFCQSPENQNFIYIRTKAPGNAPQALARIEEVMKRYNPAYPLEYTFVDDQFNNLFSNETHISQISGVFAALAIIISCLGLFGLATYTAERRTKEIGIRKVLGASVTNITTLLSKDFLQLVAIACLLAFPVGWWLMQNWLQNYEYRINVSWWIFLVAGLLAFVIALMTVSFQAIKAAMANPVKSLRTE
ncbi:acetylornithine deacetylase [Adhaeribacter arboris]|uniref:Acetylornithine deacetylase n=1 Tax=Adhaeribacter arboris TaxID=2072846 RepID=A0A2T2YF14_9BACT|nr:ABC transporter permease [Adhaeribacter arboris]PSR54100.1 acetylornithine deacetylase [Adhaeribacter arboris]